jgi:hypothetical protein
VVPVYDQHEDSPGKCSKNLSVSSLESDTGMPFFSKNAFCIYVLPFMWRVRSRGQIQEHLF